MNRLDYLAPGYVGSQATGERPFNPAEFGLYLIAIAFGNARAMGTPPKLIPNSLTP